MIVALTARMKLFGTKLKPIIGAQPPKKKIDVINDNANMLPYSAKKNSAKAIDEYSMLYPATISASASGRSKGVRLVSAKAAIKKIMANGKQGTMYQTADC